MKQFPRSLVLVAIVSLMGLTACKSESSNSLDAAPETSSENPTTMAPDNMAKSIEFLAEVSEREGVQTTESGLMYEVITEGAGPKPTASSEVTVHYEGTFPNGDVFDSSYARGEQISFPLNRVIPGWTEGLQLMSPGAKYKFYIPSDLAYGQSGGGPIGPNQALVFTVELFSFEN
jgi:FKBP-type peptidyl-prolyl cis-trans isomerase FkpA/FKBP-type peptidyl-prolyl cis-trans isomerase FklB